MNYTEGAQPLLNPFSAEQMQTKTDSDDQYVTGSLYLL